MAQPDGFISAHGIVQNAKIIIGYSVAAANRFPLKRANRITICAKKFQFKRSKRRIMVNVQNGVGKEHQTIRQ